MKTFIFYALVAVVAGSDARRTLKRCRGPAALPTIFEEDGIFVREEEQGEQKRRSPPSHILFTVLEDAASSVPSFEPTLVVPTRIASTTPVAVRRDCEFFFGDADDEAEEEASTPEPFVLADMPNGPFPGLRRTPKSFDLSDLRAALVVGDLV